MPQVVALPVYTPLPFPSKPSDVTFETLTMPDISDSAELWPEERFSPDGSPIYMELVTDVIEANAKRILAERKTWGVLKKELLSGNEGEGNG